jgi:hypothetical protein
MVKELKTPKSFLWALLIKGFHNYKLLLLLGLSIACFNVWLKFYLGIKKNWKIRKKKS